MFVLVDSTASTPVFAQIAESISTQIATGTIATGSRLPAAKELAASLGIGLAARTAVRELVKFIPFVGSAAGAALAWASTYALGRAFCEYLHEVHAGHIPPAESMKRLYHSQFTAAERAWFAAK